MTATPSTVSNATVAESGDPNATRSSIFVRLNDAKVREVTAREFLERYAPVIAVAARRFGANAEDAEDVVHDLLLVFFDRQSGFEYDPEKGRFRDLLKVCARNTWFKYQRKRRIAGKPIKELNENDASFDAVWDDAWEKQLLMKAVENTRIRYRDKNEKKDKQKKGTFQAFERIFINNETIEEVAAALGMAVDSVYKAKQRVLAAVREEFHLLSNEH